MSSEESLWCRRYLPVRDAPARLVCLPHAGGSAPFFRPVALGLGQGVDVVAVQYPGRQERRSEPPITDMAELADQLTDVLRKQPESPTTLFGHSLGAVLAFEVAQRLEADGRPAVRIVASGRRGPATRRDEQIHLLDDDGILAELRKMNGTASMLLDDEELMRASLPALRADYTAVERYSCGPDVSVSCPISVLTGDSDPKTTLDEARAWEQHTSGGFEFHVFQGGHFFLSERPAEVMAVLKGYFGPARG
ncbi:thioesterase II family protein [Catenulispora pinisilvae]|uniref:thioesterase II family protein n=1 Tax=Catenulispora pinisilvae TaxID=2705253 RepID=UPI0018926A23|nr:alpha/beta fold hydrolase [Catenulispora pinisilvae]